MKALEKQTACCESRNRSEIEDIVTFIRLELYNRGKPCGGRAIVRRLDEQSVRPLPTERTVDRILAKHCLTNGRTGFYLEDDPSSEVQFPAMSGQGPR